MLFCLFVSLSLCFTVYKSIYVYLFHLIEIEAVGIDRAGDASGQLEQDVSSRDVGILTGPDV